MKIGIDASRNRSGGARAHIIGILNNVKNFPEENVEVHIWSYDSLLEALPNHSWLIKHSPKQLKKNLIHQLWWQYKLLPIEAHEQGIDIMLNTDAGTVNKFSPAITMSRDMLSYESGEMKRFGISFQRLRLIVLKYVQNYSLKNSLAAIFLTQYAANIIQKSTGEITNYRIIPHGVSENFRINVEAWRNVERENKPIKCIYVSNVALYKHQWNVVDAIYRLRNKGYDITIDFVGGGDGNAQKKFIDSVERVDSDRKFINQYKFILHSDLPSLLGKSDVFIFASSCENMPNTLIEGMCTGLPIVSSNRGPMPEVLREGGLYFDPENIETIVLAIEKVISCEEIRKTLIEQSVSLSKQYSWERCSKETFQYIFDVYNELYKI